MQYPLNYSGTKCLSTENQNYQCSGGFHLKSFVVEPLTSSSTDHGKFVFYNNIQSF